MADYPGWTRARKGGVGDSREHERKVTQARKPVPGAPILIVGRSPWTAADAPVGLACALQDGDIVVPAAGRGRPGPEGTPTRGSAPQFHAGFAALGKLSGIGQEGLCPRIVMGKYGRGRRLPI